MTHDQDPGTVARSADEPRVVLETRVVRGSGGGPDKTILNTPRFLEPAGYKVICAYMHPPEDPGFEELRRKAERWRAPLLSVPDRGAIDPRVVREFHRICKRENVLIWHGHDYKSNLIGLLLKRFLPIRLVTTVHGWGVIADFKTQAYYAIDKFCLRHYERVICVSEDLRERSLAWGVPENRCALIENAVDTSQFIRTISPAVARARLGADPGRLVVGAVGRLSAEKGFDLLIRAADRLLGQGHDFEVWIVGEGEQRERLQGLVEEIGGSSRIRLLGYRADPIELYQAMDIFALSSVREGLPNVVLEAMALEIPVVATRIAGVPRVARDGMNALVIEPGSVETLSGALQRLLSQPELRAALGRSGRVTVEESFSLDVRMRRMVGVLDGLLDDSPET